jgi:hypothetical protein
VGGTKFERERPLGFRILERLTDGFRSVFLDIGFNDLLLSNSFENSKIGSGIWQYKSEIR